MSLRDLEKKSKVSYSFISSIENNRYQASRDKIINIANALEGSNVNELLLLAGFAPESDVLNENDDIVVSVEIMEIVGKRVKGERESLKYKDSKWTQEYVADLIGIARSTYTAYENGTKLPPVDTLNKIADIFECDTDYLSGRTNIRKKTEMNLSFYGGPQSWTEDELEEAESAVRRYREMKERAVREAEKTNNYFLLASNGFSFQ